MSGIESNMTLFKRQPAALQDRCTTASMPTSRRRDIHLAMTVRNCGQWASSVSDWLKEWETAIIRWNVQNRAAPQGNILQPLANLLELVVSLIGDASVPVGHKTHLMVAANYVISAVDLMPEDDFDVRGLVDDGAVLVLTIFWLRHQRGLEEDTLRRHWQGDNDIISEIERLEKYIRENHEVLFAESRLQFGDKLIWATIRRVATEGPEALWQNYWKEAY